MKTRPKTDVNLCPFTFGKVPIGDRTFGVRCLVPDRSFETTFQAILERVSKEQVGLFPEGKMFEALNLMKQIMPPGVDTLYVLQEGDGDQDKIYVYIVSRGERVPDVPIAADWTLPQQFSASTGIVCMQGAGADYMH